MRLETEQRSSAHVALRSAGVRHGDRVLLTMAVGTRYEPDKGVQSLAFCSSVFRDIQVLQEGTAADHASPIQGDIEIDNPEEVLPVIAGKDGIYLCKVEVICNGKVTGKIVPKTGRYHAVQRYDRDRLTSTSGCELAEEALEAVSA